ncbi:hypothetical protein [Leucobacter iarius]|uniref:hypothetical protein n=1 Tax=Leucobacter iarius TaxID=333963 RepID=UPI0031E19E22
MTDLAAFPARSSVFVDESKAREFILAASFTSSSSHAETNQKLRGLVRRGQRRIHFKSESDSSRKRLLSEMAALDVTAQVYIAPHQVPAAARTQCLEHLIDDLVDSSASRLILERNESVQVSDRRVIRARLDQRNYRRSLSYDHASPHEYPLLWVSDAVAWCCQAGGDWRRRSEPLIGGVVRLAE